MLELAVPVLSALTQFPGQINPQAAMAFFLVGAVHVALMLMALKVAGTMVAGWQVFGLAVGDGQANERAAASGPRQGEMRQQAGMSNPRRVETAMLAAGAATNDAGTASASTRLRETRVYATASNSAGSASPNPTNARTRGIGNRFRPVQSRVLARKTETSS